MAADNSSYLPSPRSPSSTFQEDGLINLKFGTYNPKSHISDATLSKGEQILLDSVSVQQSKDPVIKTAIVQQAQTSDSFLARKFHGQRSEGVKLKEGLPVVSFDIGTKEQLISKVNFVIVAKFSHGRPLFREFQSFLSSLKFQGQFGISVFDHKHVFIDFVAFEDFVKLWMLKNCVVKGFKVRFFRWSESFSPAMEISISPVWISLPGLPLYLLEEKALFSIASVLGNPLYIDPLNLNRRKVGAAWVCVALDVSKSLPEALRINFMSEGKVIEQLLQRIIYHDLPTFCTGCKHLGHSMDVCKVGTGDRLNKGLEQGKHVDLEKQFPVEGVLKDRQWKKIEKNLEDGEIEEEIEGEEGHMNMTEHSSPSAEFRMEDVNPFASLEDIPNVSLSETEVVLQQLTSSRTVVESSTLTTCAELKATSDEKCTLSSSEAEVVKEFEKHAEFSPHLTSAVNEDTEEITIEAPAGRSATNLTDAAVALDTYEKAKIHSANVTPRATAISAHGLTDAETRQNVEGEDSGIQQLLANARLWQHSHSCPPPFKTQQLETLRKAPKDLSTGQTSTSLACFAGSPGDREDNIVQRLPQPSPEASAPVSQVGSLYDLRKATQTPNSSLNRGQEQSQEEHVMETKALDTTVSPDAKATLQVSAAAQAFSTALSTYSGQDLLDSDDLAKDCATGVDVNPSANQQRSLDLQNGTDLQGLAQFNGMLVHQVNNRPKIVITDPKTKKIIELGRPLPNTSACHAISSTDSSCTQDVSQTHCSFSETQKYLGEMSATASSTCKEDIKESEPLKSTKKPKQSKKKAKKNVKKKPKKDLTEDEEDYSSPEYWKKLQEYREANPFPDYSEDYKDVRECARWMNSIDGDFFLQDNSDGEDEVNSFLPRFQSRPSRKCPSLDYLDLNYKKSPTA